MVANLIIPDIDRETFDTLYNNVSKNIENYKTENGNWIYDFWKNKGYDILPGKLEVDIVNLDPYKEDIDNAIALYEKLEISPMIASSGMFWTIYAHHELPYLLKKFPLGDDNKENEAIIYQHYLCNWDAGKREIGRCALSKLWWIVESTIDYNRTDHYELTREALMQASTVSEILERPATTMNREISRQLLEYSLEQRKLGNPLLREEIRRLTIHLNAIGHTVCIDAMTSKELREIIESFAYWYTSECDIH